MPAPPVCGSPRLLPVVPSPRASTLRPIGARPLSREARTELDRGRRRYGMAEPSDPTNAAALRDRTGRRHGGCDSRRFRKVCRRLSPARRERSHWSIAIRMMEIAFKEPAYLKAATLSFQTALVLDGQVRNCGAEARASFETEPQIAPRESNLNFLFRLSLEFYRLVSSSVARGSIPERSEAGPRTGGLHGLAEIKAVEPVANRQLR